jgi:hypothetical protein
MQIKLSYILTPAPSTRFSHSRQSPPFILNREQTCIVQVCFYDFIELCYRRFKQKFDVHFSFSALWKTNKKGIELCGSRALFPRYADLKLIAIKQFGKTFPNPLGRAQP